MAQPPVYVGFWRNWGNADGSGSLLDLTLTVPRVHGSLIVAFLAVFLSAAVSQVWPILSFVIHQARSTPSARSALYHQQQALLSNRFGPAAAAASLTKLAWTWRRTPLGKTVWSSTLLLLAASLSLVLLAAAGLATSRVQLASDEVLVTSDTCGWPEVPGLPNDDRQQESQQDGQSMEEALQSHLAWTAWLRWAYRNVIDHVQSCDRGSETQLEKCRTFTRNSLPLASRNVTCPFSDDLCGVAEAFEVDTGYIDTSRDLGINGNAYERLQFRKVMTCAPIAAEERHSTDWTDERPESGAGFQGDMYKYYNIGNGFGQNYTWVVTNYTLSSHQVDMEKQVFSLGSLYRIAGVENPDGYGFAPMPALDMTDADVTVLFLGNNARFHAPVTDPWFRATNTTDPTGAERIMSPQDPFQFHISDRLVSAMACTEKYQFCNGNGCTPLAGITSNDTLAWYTQLEGAQKAAFSLAYMSLSHVLLGRSVIMNGPGILRANEFLWSGDGWNLATGVPPNHWQDEVVNFMQIATAGLQRVVVEYAAKSDVYLQSSDGPLLSSEYLVHPETPAEWDMCGRIRVRDARFTNFSVVGLVATLAAGVLLTVVNTCLLPGAGFWVQKKLRRSSHGEREWRGGHLFMLQKDALESKGVGPWRVDERTGIPWVPPTDGDDGSLLNGRPDEITMEYVTPKN